ncbi:uracil-DNA glycosylase [Paraburkholderia sp. GV068]|jgi:uracil-DNA glycosylase|uniref:uracil-DNA glycosylase n=1 Tax=Paraburkholderia TaxID=1822464 RepID=UPI000D2F8B2F|nr:MULTISPECIES: uracil-DNA glycosylase [unclassified Paraburkholderia]PTQ91571.1 uracil-DNA glycosylase [Paraburkholderia sp. GV072]PUA93807.1 uracil-DNA glycosylase [Paraburkholderia sp. GV068]
MTSSSRTRSTPSQASLFGDAAAPASDTSGATETPSPSPSQQHAHGTLTLEAQFAALPAAWRTHLKPFIESDAYAPLCRFVDGERAAGKTVYPTDVFRALRLTSPDDVKVVILGQDPYHGEDRGTPQAHGLAFSVAPNVRTPPSLRNIFKEIATSLGHEPPRHGCLDTWAKQGVLLLNTVLTVERNSAASHAKRGWEKCTDTLIHELAMRHDHLVFMLWGAHAQAKRALLGGKSHYVLEAPHPSPLSAHRGFLGCGHFAKANEYLVQHGRTPIDWRLPDQAQMLA